MNAVKIKKLRKKLGLDTSRFGELIGVSGRTVEGWEQGRRKPMQPAIKIMRTL
jgi:putative transcriptional regulator